MRTLVVISSALLQSILMPEISDTAYVRGRHQRMILFVSYSSLPDINEPDISWILPIPFFFTSYSRPLQSSSSVRAAFPSNFASSVHYGTLSGGLLPGNTSSQTLANSPRPRTFQFLCLFRGRMCCFVPPSLLFSRLRSPTPQLAVHLTELLVGTPIIFSLAITAQSKLFNQNHYTPTII